MSDRKHIDWRRVRQATQLICLLGFVWLFVQTEYRNVDQLPYPVSLLFRIDPLAALADALAPGPFSWGLLWPALLLLGLTALFGRFFCGWICPLGTSLDGLGKLVGRGCMPVRPAWRRFKYLLLIGLVAEAIQISRSAVRVIRNNRGVALGGNSHPLSRTCGRLRPTRCWRNVWSR